MSSQPKRDFDVKREIAVEWRSGRPEGEVRVADGRLLGLEVVKGKGRVIEGARFRSEVEGPFRIKIAIDGLDDRYGVHPTIVSILTKYCPFSFFLRDVSARFPIWIPAYAVAVSVAEDRRTFDQIEEALAELEGRTRLEQIESEPEESFASAARVVRQMSCHTWLGVSRNMRIFAIGEKLDWIQPRFHYLHASLPENDRRPFRYEFVMGRGWGPCEALERSLEERVLPILHGRLEDADVLYELTTFATLQDSPLTDKTLRGTDFLLADGHAKQHMFTAAQQARYDSLLPQEMQQGEETLLCLRISATNHSRVPRYAFLRTVWPSKGLGEASALDWDLESETGFSTYNSGTIFAISKLNQSPLRQPEVVILLEPGEAVTLDVFLPHRPISRARAEGLSNTSFKQALEEAKAFWRSKLRDKARINLPEARITEMIQAGILHLDLVAYGAEPDGAIAATIGDYPPIGSESSPIIQFFDSMGWHDVARRAIGYFFEKQHDNGFMQNFNNYMLEPGAVLWTAGEHYRYTQDDGWAEQIAPKIRKTCEFLRNWRRRNQTADLRGRGYGLLEGKTADPEDPFRSFMLNGYAYLGLSRSSEIFERLGLLDAKEWRQEAEDLKRDIRRAFFSSLAFSPVVPLGDGRWCSTCPPWPESRGALALHVDGTAWHTHGSMVARDSLLGPLYLVFQEVLDASEPEVAHLLDFHSELMTDRNVVFSQPYYSRHPWIHLQRGENKPFLQAYYNTMASLADRETYTFWEHYFGASAHKTHEEAWFLMETRWMLYLEQGTSLRLLTGIPRAYLESGNRIELDNVATHFGPLSMRLESRLDAGYVLATVSCASPRRPRRVELRIPHPARAQAAGVRGGIYDPKQETVIVEPFQGAAEVRVDFSR